MTLLALSSKARLLQKTLQGRGGVASSSTFLHKKRWISSSQLTIEHQTDTTAFDKRPAKENLLFGQTASDHMLMIEFEKESMQWGKPRIVPYQDLVLSPAASCLHYGTYDYL
jgi:branched-chain amino acid aminotransferase